MHMDLDVLLSQSGGSNKIEASEWIQYFPIFPYGKLQCLGLNWLS